MLSRHCGLRGRCFLVHTWRREVHVRLPQVGEQERKKWCLAPLGKDTTFVRCSRQGGRELPLDGNLLHTALVATALEAGREESVEDGGCRLVVDETTRQNDNVGVIVLAG